MIAKDSKKILRDSKISQYVQSLLREVGLRSSSKNTEALSILTVQLAHFWHGLRMEYPFAWRAIQREQRRLYQKLSFKQRAMLREEDTKDVANLLIRWDVKKVMDELK